LRLVALAMVALAICRCLALITRMRTSAWWCSTQTNLRFELLLELLALQVLVSDGLGDEWDWSMVDPEVVVS
jgi:hypothetical protein